MNFSNQSLWLGCLYEMTLAGQIGWKVCNWQPAFVLILERLGQLREALSGVWINADGSGNRERIETSRTTKY